jgi:CheY-like chemotaxis protein
MKPGAFASLKVVIIDDNEHMRTLLHTMLRGFGTLHIYEAADGEHGFELVQLHRPDFVVTDYSMKPVNGVEFIKRVRTLDPPLAWVPAIMVTGHAERRYIENARDAGITEILCKPITVHGLYWRVVEIIERPRPFVKAPVFVGPDRRRRHGTYMGPRRRQNDSGHDLVFL